MMFDRGRRHPSDKPLPSSLPTSPLPLLASDQVLEEDAMYERDFNPHLDLFEDQIFRY